MRTIAALALVFATAVATPAAASAPAGRQQDFADASASAGVPRDVLLAVSYLESRWDANNGLPSTSGGYGPMHLTSFRAVAAGSTVDGRGDDTRPKSVTVPASTGSSETLGTAAGLTGLDEAALRGDPAANIRGGAALLASYQRDLGAPGGADSDPAAWYGAVARYSGADTADAAAQFADEVYATLAEGADRLTDDGQRVTLAAHPSLHPQKTWLDRLGLRRPARADGLECPPDLPCEWIPAPYQAFGAGDYGNHDLSDRPARQKVQYIVIHDTEATYDTTIGLVQDPTYVSWNYTIRSADGHVAQHVKTKDVAWHAGNWYVNATSVGIEHEGFAAEGAWYTEAMYRSSAKLVRYLAQQLGIPLDRSHIIGHDNVPGTVPSTVRGMHWDPGPYWDWSHYFDLMHAPFRAIGTPHTGLVMIDPSYDTNRPAYTGCTAAGTPCPSHGASQLILHTAPSDSAPLLADVGLHPDGSASTMALSDHGSRVSAGQTYAVAGRDGDWTAVWYLGQKGWFYNPPSAPAARWATGLVAVPKPGLATVAVYGRAYPERSAYPAGVPYQSITPLQYTFAAGQRYAVGNVVQGEYYRAVTFDGSSPGDWTVIRGDTWYAQIQFGHRVMYVNLADVQLVPSFLGAP